MIVERVEEDNMVRGRGVKMMPGRQQSALKTNMELNVCREERTLTLSTINHLRTSIKQNPTTKTVGLLKSAISRRNQRVGRNVGCSLFVAGEYVKWKVGLCIMKLEWREGFIPQEINRDEGQTCFLSAGKDKLNTPSTRECPRSKWIFLFVNTQTEKTTQNATLTMH